MGTDTDIEGSSPKLEPLEEFDPSKEPNSEPAEGDVSVPLEDSADESGDQDQSDQDDEVVSEGETKDFDTGGDDQDEDNEPRTIEDPPDQPAGDNDKNDFVALEDDEIEEKRFVDGGQKPDSDSEDQADKARAKAPENKEVLPNSIAGSQKSKKSTKDPSATPKIIVSALILLMVAGAVVYSKPALFGLKGKLETTVQASPASEKSPAETGMQQQKPEPSRKTGPYLSKLAEVDRLRDALLSKTEEIYRLKLHYRNGIAELANQIFEEMRKTNIPSYEDALQNKRIELNLRTIQRRQVYIKELEKPNQWAHKGSEELLFLKRKVQIDLDMTDMASGIDLDRHMRYLNAALQKYQPSADKLAVDPPPVERMPLETIWRQLNDQLANKVQAPIGKKNEKIIAEICSGDYTRIAELTVITPQAAKCLAHMEGSDLFLNGLTQLPPRQAEHLFKWKGNWICLNSVKTLSPAAAKYLFKWGGKWISLNGLTEFSPELGLYLTEWKGEQLELMGLNSMKSKPDQRALKYLALWETMGGKLFISDDIRYEMEQVM